jgi:hypothetical protein
MKDDVRVPGYVTLVCGTPGCGWGEFREPLSEDVGLAKEGTFRCDFCLGRLVRHADGSVTTAVTRAI